MIEQLTSMRAVLCTVFGLAAAATIVVALSLPQPASAAPPDKLQSVCLLQPPTAGEVAVARADCDVLAEVEGYQAGFVRPCAVGPGTKKKCIACKTKTGEQAKAWTCFGVPGTLGI